MSQIEIALVVGSLRKDSFNKKLALSDFLFEQVRIDDLAAVQPGR